MDFPYDGLLWYIDPVAACLLGILAIALAVLVSTDFLHLRVVHKSDLQWCQQCECWHGVNAPHIGERE
jgi:hypothetical protein